MPHRSVVAKEMADFLSVIAHPARLRLIDELRSGERDVHSLATSVAITQSATSQHLMVLRAHRVVTERREGRHVLYRLTRSGLSDWLLQGVSLLPGTAEEIDHVREAIQQFCSEHQRSSAESAGASTEATGKEV